MYHLGKRVNFSEEGWRDLGQGSSDSEVKWNVDGWKASRYPPIHDQIDTPIDFSMAVRKWQQRRDGNRSHREKQKQRRAELS